MALYHLESSAAHELGIFADTEQGLGARLLMINSLAKGTGASSIKTFAVQEGLKFTAAGELQPSKENIDKLNQRIAELRRDSEANASLIRKFELIKLFLQINSPDYVCQVAVKKREGEGRMFDVYVFENQALTEQGTAQYGEGSELSLSMSTGAARGTTAVSPTTAADHHVTKTTTPQHGRNDMSRAMVTTTYRAGGESRAKSHKDITISKSVQISPDAQKAIDILLEYKHHLSRDSRAVKDLSSSHDNLSAIKKSEAVDKAIQGLREGRSVGDAINGLKAAQIDHRSTTGKMGSSWTTEGFKVLKSLAAIKDSSKRTPRPH